jgi:hydrogenase maturation protease
VNEWEWQLLEEKLRVNSLTIGGSEVRVGDRVRLLPRKGGDILDLALVGQVAVIESIEQDYEGKNHICVVLDDDPGKDLGLLRQPGHRFFFDAEEIEPLADEEPQPSTETQQPRILVAGIGNIFLGDDGFGVEVANRLSASELPAGVRVVDFGIRGFDLAYALQDGYETVILVDAYPHGQTPGTVSLIEPDLSELDEMRQAAVETHGMDPLNVMRMAATMCGGLKANILLVGCEPATFGGEEGHIGLSEVVETAVDEAAKMVVSTVNRLLQEQR